MPIKQDDIKINISGMITNYETFHNEKIFDVIKNHIEKIYPEVKNFELFNKDFNKNVKEIKIQKISDLLLYPIFNQKVFCYVLVPFY